MNDLYCKYCNNTWKYKKEYEKHLACCEYFYNYRRNPKPEMDDYGGKLPTQKELFRFVQELSLKCSRLEQDVARLKNNVSTRQKKVIVDCLNHPEQIPDNTFMEWWKGVTLHFTSPVQEYDAHELIEHWSSIRNPFLFRVFRQGLVEGIKYILSSYISSKTKKQKLPIRCFSQKHNIFYIYSGTTDTEVSKKTQWRIMTTDDFEIMIDGISQLFVREFLVWQRENCDIICDNETRSEEQMMYMIRVNSMKPTKERGMSDIRKWLFSILEENAKTEFEFV
jgi:hypothetical protein